MTLCCGHMVAVSAEDAHQEALLVLESLNASLAPSVLCLAHWWMEEAEAVTDWKPALPSQLPALAELSSNRTAAFGPSHSFSLKFRRLKVNGLHVKEVGICTEDLWERARTSEQEKQKSRWSFFQVSCASQARDLPLIPENIFTRRNG